MHLLINIAKILEEFSDFASQILDQIAQGQRKGKDSDGNTNDKYEGLLESYL